MCHLHVKRWAVCVYSITFINRDESGTHSTYQKGAHALHMYDSKLRIQIPFLIHLCVFFNIFSATHCKNLCCTATWEIFFTNFYIPYYFYLSRKLKKTNTRRNDKKFTKAHLLQKLRGNSMFAPKNKLKKTDFCEVVFCKNDVNTI